LLFRGAGVRAVTRIVRHRCIGPYATVADCLERRDLDASPARGHALLSCVARGFVTGGRFSAWCTAD